MAEQKPVKSRRSKMLLLIGAATLAALCLACLAIYLLAPSPDAEPTQVAEASPQGVIATDIPQPTQPAIATDTSAPVPTRTPAPTATQEPTATPTETPDPDLVAPGTYLVGTDIQPGLYIGFAGEGLFSSCYWARLSNLSGDLDSILSNDNSIGQFYIEVLGSDFALETACPIKVFHPESVSVSEFPSQIGPGYYLVGVDIQLGIYRGQAGEDITDSCYWARLANFTGEMGSILANDNAIGQYFVEVSAGDYGLNTGCELELIE